LLIISLTQWFVKQEREKADSVRFLSVLFREAHICFVHKNGAQKCKCNAQYHGKQHIGRVMNIQIHPGKRN